MPPMTSAAAIRLRLADPSDAAAIAAVAVASPGAAPWSASQYEGAVRGDYQGWLAEQGSSVIAFLFARNAADEVEILNLAVTPQRRRAGLARQMIDRALGDAKSRGVTRAFLEVRPSNAAAIALYRNCGFADAGRRACYYSAPVEDALVLSKML